MEIWDAYDKDLNKLDLPPLIRTDAIPDGIYHLVCDILVVHTDGSFLLMRRDKRKHLGGLWEASAGGSAFSGEDALTCAGRELFEETGIIPDSIEQKGIEVNDAHHAVYCEFICLTSSKKNAVILQEGETTDYRWVSKNRLLSLPEEQLASQRILKYLE